MSLDTTTKKKIIQDFATEKEDTGSPEVQVALLTEKITRLVTHLKEHKKDEHSRRGLVGMVNKRRRHLNFLLKRSQERYTILTKKLGLAK